MDDQTNSHFCFTHPDPGGEDIYLFTLINSKGTTVSISNYGGIITSFRVIQKDGSVNNIVLGFDKMEQYLDAEYVKNYPFFGAAIGRYGNRISQGKFSIDGRQYSLEQNLGPDHLHGGISGFDKKVWACDSISPASLLLKYQSKDGEEGYPGKLDVMLRFELNDENELSYEYTAVTDKPTAVNLTHHSYFNLNNGKGTIGDHYVKINGSFVLGQDKNHTANGNLLPVEGTAYDFRQFRQINQNGNAAESYDQSFVLDTKTTPPAAEAYSEESGLKLQVFTTEPVVHLYTGQSIPPLNGYGPFSGFCLETQIHPNAINIPHFPDTVLRPGDVYHQKTIYRIVGS